MPFSIRNESNTKHYLRRIFSKQDQSGISHVPQHSNLFPETCTRFSSLSCACACTTPRALFMPVYCTPACTRAHISMYVWPRRVSCVLCSLSREKERGSRRKMSKERTTEIRPIAWCLDHARVRLSLRRFQTYSRSGRRILVNPRARPRCSVFSFFSQSARRRLTWVPRLWRLASEADSVRRGARAEQAR